MERKIGRPSKGPRAVVIFRLPTPLRTQTRIVTDLLGTTLTAFVEQLATVDVTPPCANRLVPTPTDLAARRTGHRGRPSRGPRTTITLKVSHELADQIKERSAALDLSINDYLECLVSQDARVSRAAVGEGMVLDQSA